MRIKKGGKEKEMPKENGIQRGREGEEAIEPKKEVPYHPLPLPPQSLPVLSLSHVLVASNEEKNGGTRTMAELVGSRGENLN